MVFAPPITKRILKKIIKKKIIKYKDKMFSLFINTEKGN